MYDSGENEPSERLTPELQLSAKILVSALASQMSKATAWGSGPQVPSVAITPQGHLCRQCHPAPNMAWSAEEELENLHMAHAKEADIWVSEAEPQTELHEQGHSQWAQGCTSLFSRGESVHGASSALLYKGSWRTSTRGWRGWPRCLGDWGIGYTGKGWVLGLFSLGKGRLDCFDISNGLMES